MIQYSPRYFYRRFLLEQLESIHCHSKASCVTILTIASLIVILPRIVISIHRTCAVLCFLVPVLINDICWCAIIHFDSINNLSITCIAIDWIIPVASSNIRKPVAIFDMNTILDRTLINLNCCIRNRNTLYSCEVT